MKLELKLGFIAFFLSLFFILYEIIKFGLIGILFETGVENYFILGAFPFYLFGSPLIASLLAPLCFFAYGLLLGKFTTKISLDLYSSLQPPLSFIKKYLSAFILLLAAPFLTFYVHYFFVSVFMSQEFFYSFLNTLPTLIGDFFELGIFFLLPFFSTFAFSYLFIKLISNNFSENPLFISTLRITSYFLCFSSYLLLFNFLNSASLYQVLFIPLVLLLVNFYYFVTFDKTVSL